MKPSKQWLQRLKRLLAVPGQLNNIQESLGRIEGALQAGRPRLTLRDYEFKVYSQWGEDGIIDQLVSRIPIPDKTFVEFGVETYVEANTLYLLKHRHWRGLVIDGSKEHIETIRRSEPFWKYDLYADCSFITRDNINDIITRNRIGGDIGLLSVDIDGNDYWIWEAIDVIRPRVVVSEYNSLFGPSAKVSVPYVPDFFRKNLHASNGYFGASVAGLAHLGNKKGYSLVAGNSAGNNVFFVRDDCLGDIVPVKPEEAFVASAFREARSAEGEVELLTIDERRAAIGGMTVVEVDSGNSVKISSFA